jgi:type I restriction enzyme S subunit
MAGKWKELTVGEIAASTRNALVGGPFGSNLVSNDYVEQGVPVIRGQNMGDRWVSGDFVFVTVEKAQSLEANIARAGDIIFTQRGTLGQVSLVPEERFERYLVSQSQMKLSVNQDIADPLFFYYVFCSSEQQDYIRQHAIQTGVPHTNLGILRSTPISLPPIGEQRAIARILGVLDDKIELSRRTNETLEAMARALFKSWFVDFDPVRAKSEGRDTGLPKSVANLFPSNLDDEDMPSGWHIGTLDDVADLNPEVWKAHDCPEQVEYVDLSNTKWGTIEATEIYGWNDAPSRARRILRAGDTIIGTVRPGNGSYAFIAKEGLTGSTGFAVLRPKKFVFTEFAYCAATAPENIERLSHLADGAAYPAVRPNVVADTGIVVPPLPVLQAFSEICGPFVRCIEINKQESVNLAAIRDALLPKLISGEIRVKDAERFVQRVA